MDIRAISSSKKITVEIAINVDKIEYKEEGLDRRNQNKKSFSRSFVVPLSDGTSYKGCIWIWEHEGSPIHFSISNVKSLSGTASLMVSKGNVVSECAITVIKSNGKSQPALATKTSGQIDFLKQSLLNQTKTNYYKKMSIIHSAF